MEVRDVISRVRRRVSELLLVGVRSQVEVFVDGWLVAVFWDFDLDVLLNGDFLAGF